MQVKRLAIISDCLHMQTSDGRTGTDNSIFLRQMEALAMCFEETLLCCPFVTTENFQHISYYTNNSISFLPVPNVGGTTLMKKIGILKVLPTWYRSFKIIDKWADMVYQRFPNNINIPGFFYFYLKQKKVFGTYTGNWFDYEGEPFTYRLQKTFLKKWFRGTAGIYFDDNRYPHLFKTFSPSYTSHDWQAEMLYVDAKKERLRSKALSIPVFITVGLLVPKKNQQFILDCFLILKNEGFKFQLFIVGDGLLNESYENFVQQNDLSNCVFITGKKNYADLRELYRKADFLIHASLVEGYVKVPVEGLFHGVIPLLNNISIANEMIGNNERGYIFSVKEKELFLKLIKNLLSNGDELLCKIDKGRQYAYENTIELWQQHLLKQLEKFNY
jgi:glycosyltransferase involved in cell wall biosynthesis